MFKKEFDASILTKYTNFSIDNCEFSFCETIHKGGSYATKIKYQNKVFVYVSDIARVSKILVDFVKNSDVVMVDLWISL